MGPRCRGASKSRNCISISGHRNCSGKESVFTSIGRMKERCVTAVLQTDEPYGLSRTSGAVDLRRPLLTCLPSIPVCRAAFHHEENTLSFFDVVDRISRNAYDVRFLTGFKRANFVGQTKQIG